MPDEKPKTIPEMIGASGLEENNGFLRVDFLDDMRGDKKYKNLNSMRLNSPILGALLVALKYPIRSVQWFFTSTRGEDDPRLKLLEEARDNMSTPWSEHLLEALTMIDYGFAPCAIQYRREGSKILWDRFMLMGQDTVYRWDIDKGGMIKGMWQVPHLYSKRIPIERMVLFRVNVERNSPEGRSMLRNAYVSWYYANELQKIEAIGKERGMSGIPVITLPQEADRNADNAASDVNIAARTVRNIRADEQAGVVLPFGWVLSLLTTGINSDLSMNHTIQRYESRMLMSVLAQFVMVGLGMTGGQVKSESDMDLFNIVVNSLADILAEAHTTQSIPRLMELNGLDAEGLRLEHSPPGDVNFVELSQALAMLGDKVTWTAEDEVLIRSVLKLPRWEPSKIEQMRQEAIVAEEAREARSMARQTKNLEAQKIQNETEAGVVPNKPTLRSGKKVQQRRDGSTSNPNNKFESTPTTDTVAENAPDDDVRLQHERKFFKGISNYFQKLSGRLEDAAKTDGL